MLVLNINYCKRFRMDSFLRIIKNRSCDPSMDRPNNSLEFEHILQEYGEYVY